MDCTTTPLFKFLATDMMAPIGHGRYTLNRWCSVRGPLVPCGNGLHAAPADNLVSFISETLWRVEIGDEFLWHEDDALGRKLVARRMRVVEQITTWNERSARLFAADCAERVLPLFEAQCPDDTRPRQAIETARRFADGLASREELATARGAAWAADSAPYSAAYSAADRAYRAASRAADSAADSAAERQWQNAHLAEMLGLEVAP